jgi:protein-tyrosine phosphatase
VVINCTDDETNEFFKNDTDYQPQYFTYTLHDEETDDLSLIEHTMNHSCDIIHNALQSGGCVLVHCVAGISRSPTLVLYYLLMHHQTTLKQGLLDLISVRNFVAPNLRYMATLIQHEQKILKKSTLSLEEYILHYMGLISMDEMQCDELKERQERFLEIIQPVVQFCADDHGELAYRLINLEIPLNL